MNNGNVWEYIDGTSVNGEYGFDLNGNPTVGITPWDKGQPDYSSNMEHCVHLAVFHNDRFNDRACWFSYLVALCMREETTCVNIIILFHIYIIILIYDKYMSMYMHI